MPLNIGLQNAHTLRKHHTPIRVGCQVTCGGFSPPRRDVLCQRAMQVPCHLPLGQRIVVQYYKPPHTSG